MAVTRSRRLRAQLTDSRSTNEGEEVAAQGRNEDEVTAGGDAASHDRPVRKPREASGAADVWGLEKGVLILVGFDKLGRATGKGSFILADFLGSVARKGNLCPINLKTWKKVHITYRVKIMETIQSGRGYWHLLGTSGRTINIIKKKYFIPGRPLQEIIDDVPKDVFDYQWKELVIHWSSTESEKASKAGKDARSNVRILHASGCTSFAEREHRFHQEHNRSPSRLEAFALEHKSANGSFVTEAAEQIMEDALNLIVERSRPDMSEVEKLALENEVYNELVGVDKFGRARGYGSGVTAAELNELNYFGGSSSRNDGDERYEALVRDYQVKVKECETVMNEMTERMTRNEEEARLAREEAQVAREEARVAYEKALEDARAELRLTLFSMEFNLQS